MIDFVHTRRSRKSWWSFEAGRNDVGALGQGQNMHGQVATDTTGAGRESEFFDRTCRSATSNNACQAVQRCATANAPAGHQIPGISGTWASSSGIAGPGRHVAGIGCLGPVQGETCQAPSTRVPLVPRCLHYRATLNNFPGQIFHNPASTGSISFSLKLLAKKNPRPLRVFQVQIG